MRKKSTNLDLSVKKKKCNQILKVDRRRKSRTNKKIKTKKNKTLKKGGMKRGRDDNSYLEQKVHKLGRITSGATARGPSPIDNVKRAWWKYSIVLIEGLFYQKENIVTSILQNNNPFEEIVNISFSNTDYTFKIKIEDNTHDVYLKIFLSGQFVTQKGNSYTTWIELFHISDHPGSSKEFSPGAIHVKYLPNIEQIIYHLKNGHITIPCGRSQIFPHYEIPISSEFRLTDIISDSGLPKPSYIKIDEQGALYLDTRGTNQLTETVGEFLNRINNDPQAKRGLGW